MDNKNPEKSLSKVRIAHWMVISAMLLLYDAFSVSVSFFIALWLRFDCSFSLIPDYYLSAWMRFTPFYIAFCLLLFWCFRLYQSIWRFASFSELQRALSANSIAGLVHIVAITFLMHRMPVSYFAMGIVLQTILVIGIRFAYRFLLLLRSWRDKRDRSRYRVMLIGAGEAGQMILRDLMKSQDGQDRVCCIIDDNPNKWNRYVDGVPVVGGREDILLNCEKYQIDRIYLAIPSASAEARRDILDICKETGCEMKILPSIGQLLKENVTVGSMKDVAIEDLLGRDPIKTDMTDVFRFLAGKTILVTGAAGFIGSNLVKRLFKEVNDATIIGIDNMNDYYDVSLKEWRLEQLKQLSFNSQLSTFNFIKGDIADKATIDDIFEQYKPAVVVNLAAQAGVRYSITNPDAYIQSNLIGFYNILEACRNYPVEHLVYASSSSVYGSNKKIPYSTDDKVDNPVSLYAATKKSNELMAHAYSKLYNIPSTGLRFFTVYGPAGRPDMAYFGFTNKLVKGETIQIFNFGNCKRDFTYVDDIVEGVVRIMQGAPEKKTGEDGLPVPPYAVYNIGNNQPENLLTFVDILQQELIRAKVLPEDYDFEAHKKLVPMQPGDVPVTYADTSALERDYGFKPSTSLRDGLRAFAEWYAGFYQK